ncbi:hypothetical protein [Tenacibaculum sp. Cn5-34]|uniref:hypothetical protein n=1 Tax=Tenacibaculum sp. Cn5-34 TaxID=2908919 RepID=UPI001F2738FF|nr:hypothetical protein [Tenacibaculum sp. Cn5-34]MCF2934626.1 hypothetical protein [Tenacibaculum sp. Cn5-34]MCG7510836.1 hypothetical protein [Tenacibaculum sp. Cn5-46]
MKRFLYGLIILIAIDLIIYYFVEDIYRKLARNISRILYFVGKFIYAIFLS